MDDWKEGLPEDLRELPTIKDIKSIDDLVRTHDSAQRMLGNSVRVPGNDAGQDQWDEFLQKVGKIDGIARVPKDPEDDGWRDVLKKAGLPEEPTGYGLENEALAQHLHEAGLTKKQAKKVADMMAESESARLEAQHQRAQEAVAELKKRWGDGFERHAMMAQHVIKMVDEQNGNTNLRDALERSDLGNDPAVIEAFAAIGKLLDEKPIEKTGSGMRFGMSPAEARAQLDEIMANKDHPYHTGNKDAVDRVLRLHEIIHGTDDAYRSRSVAA